MGNSVINLIYLLFFCRSFIGTIRLQVFEHYIIEAHPDDTIPDLRLDRPLKSFVDYWEPLGS